MVEGTLSNGFKFQIEDERLDNYETFEKLCMIDNNNENLGLIIEVYNDLLGTDQYRALKEYIKKQDGRISTRKMFELMQEMFAYEGDLKNSQPSPASLTPVDAT